MHLYLGTRCIIITYERRTIPDRFIAEKAHVNIQTIRYYERIKLLAPKLRKDSKRIRFYDDESLKTLNFIKHAQELGFQLEEIKELLKLRSESTGRCDRVRKRPLRNYKVFKVKS